MCVFKKFKLLFPVVCFHFVQYTHTHLYCYSPDNMVFRGQNSISPHITIFSCIFTIIAANYVHNHNRIGLSNMHASFIKNPPTQVLTTLVCFGVSTFFNAINKTAAN